MKWYPLSSTRAGHYPKKRERGILGISFLHVMKVFVKTAMTTNEIYGGSVVFSLIFHDMSRLLMIFNQFCPILRVWVCYYYSDLD